MRPKAPSNRRDTNVFKIGDFLPFKKFCEKLITAGRSDMSNERLKILKLILSNYSDIVSLGTLHIFFRPNYI